MSNDNLDLAIDQAYKHYIGGEWASSNNETFDSHNPSNGKLLASFAKGNDKDIDAAVSAAKSAFTSWSQTSVTERATILNKIAELIENNADRLAKIETLDNGKPIRETSFADIPLAADHFRYFAGVIRAEENTSAVLDENTHSYNYAEPIGVVGQIIPWNFPLLMAAWKIAPALAAGNCIVLKPAEQTPLSIMELMKLTHDIIPAGVVNVVTGFGPEAGAPLVRHPDVNKVAFTGSSEVGKVICKMAAESMKPVTLELGGKSPNIIFPDANINKAIDGLVMAFAFNQGEVCTCGSRALIHEDIYDKVVEGMIAKIKKIKIGDPMDPETMLGSQASKEQFDKIVSYLEHAKQAEDCEVIYGGDPVPGDGYFIKPTLVATNNDSKLAREEIFGPVLGLIKFKNEEEAVAIANDTNYGLGAGLWTTDINRVHRMGRQIEAGRIWVNNYHAYPAHAPFGGYKESGLGRETHKMMLNAYRQNKNLIISYGNEETGFYPS